MSAILASFYAAWLLWFGAKLALVEGIKTTLPDQAWEWDEYGQMTGQLLAAKDADIRYMVDEANKLIDAKVQHHCNTLVTIQRVQREMEMG